MNLPSSSPEMKPRVGIPRERANNWWWYLAPQMWLRKIVSQDDTPHSIALGTSVGTFVAFTPTVGIQMVIVLLIAWILNPVMRFNRIAALVAVYISNPITTLPIYWFNYWIGTFFVEGTLTRKQLAGVLEYDGLVAWWASLWELTVNIGWPLLIGSGVVAVVCAALAYAPVKWLVKTIQRRHPA